MEFSKETASPITDCATYYLPLWLQEYALNSFSLWGQKYCMLNALIFINNVL